MNKQLKNLKHGYGNDIPIKAGPESTSMKDYKYPNGGKNSDSKKPPYDMTEPYEKC